MATTPPARSATEAWYEQLRKPRWAPKPQLFGLVWSILYPLILGSYGFFMYRTIQGYFAESVAALFTLNLILNFMFTPIQFRLRNNLLALLDLLLVDLTLIWLVLIMDNYSVAVQWALLPYLVWVLFATALQISITYLNCKQPAKA